LLISKQNPIRPQTASEIPDFSDTLLAISAPVAVVDPETRDHFGDQIGEFSQSVRQIGSDRPN